jgi:hypothetical protein
VTFLLGFLTMNRKNFDSFKETIDAAAMQSDLAKRFSLPGAITRKVSHTPSGRGIRVPQDRNIVVRSSNRTTPPTISCVCCESINSDLSRICGTCGYYLHSVNQSSDWTLAESRGLVRAAPKVKVMIESEWKAVESSLAGTITKTKKKTIGSRYYASLPSLYVTFCHTVEYRNSNHY